MSLNKRKFNTVDNGQEVTIELIEKWLNDDLSKAAYVIHLVRTDPVIKKVMVEHFYEQSRKAAEAEKNAPEMDFHKEISKHD